ncbi:hypothetical protein FP2506_00040 [Fulvimarina pelagi HTCC2506]|uniref:Uncharacterized protein n=1 Tax=Fulvimarina pelagi HTCC2506 TaxID=314231 RepID=Q0FXX7_9HYPH|nr:hypothetical protein [Fulvimarina pelagi]EAU39756.1 hypothetical protein FP2506_00040 [Fulvimarina pelagi HTCC2506]
MSLITGLLLGVISIIAMRMTGIERQRGTWVTTVLAIASFYVVFAVEYGNHSTLIIHTIIAAVSAFFAVLATATNAWWLAATLIAHGVFDLAAGRILPDPSPSWWGPFCVGVDLTLGVWLTSMVYRGDFDDLPGN